MFKKATGLAALVVLLATVVLANPVSYNVGFTVYPNTGMYGEILDKSPALIVLYVMHVGYQPASASQFIAQKPACFNATWVGETSPYLALGDSQVGVSIGYGMCLTPPIHVLTINYFGTGTTGDCCWYPLDCDPNDPNGIAGKITIVDCSSGDPVRAYIDRGSSWINPTVGCPSPVAETTWGRVKALYAD